ncbi:MAG: hypothetical protein IPM15_20760 [Betaproteobacteria bacterium]|nr:hypothetical protein [Betaproteobacteria bacterium]MCC6248730.1 hypothetical protein [Rubrivivax sp.]MCL4697916.1 hypothetical protein [Burkholderiaceae bacterium]
MTSATSASDLTRLVPGFDFLQGLMKGGGASLPGFGQWIAPTLEPAELQKRIDELRTVQYWLDQNSKLIGTTVQALEVQRMTLVTLKGMNLQMADLAESLTLKTPKAPAPARAAPPPPAPSPASSPAAAVDPMQWWGALTQQFTELATRALNESGADAAPRPPAPAPKAAAEPPARPLAEPTSIERMMAMSSQATELAMKTGSAMAEAMGAAAAGATPRAKAAKSRAGASTAKGAATATRRRKT